MAQDQKIYVLFMIAFWVVTSSSSICLLEATTHPQDVAALVALHKSWLRRPISWDIGKDPCDSQWLGISCDNGMAADGYSRVTEIILINQGLAGTLDPAIRNLAFIKLIDISSNPNLHGSLPVEIGQLQSILRFYAQFCNFSGEIPKEIGNMTSLQFLGLSYNKLTGKLPATVGYLKDIRWFDVSYNSLYGPLPVSSTSGIGAGLDNLTLAEHIHIQGNRFSGHIPPSLFSQQMKIFHLLLAENELTGEIPRNINHLLHLDIIRLDNNLLTGTIPDTISMIVNLTTLQLNNNHFTGKIPDFSNNKKLQILNLGNNNFDASGIPDWIMEQKNLYSLSLESANLTGSIPHGVFNFSNHLSNVTFALNKLNGTLDLASSILSLSIVNLTDNQIEKVNRGSYSNDLILNGNPYCASRSSSECLPQPYLATAPPSQDTMNNCEMQCPDSYRRNPKNYYSCTCVHPVMAKWRFYAMKIPKLTLDHLNTLEEDFISSWTKSLFVEGIKLEKSQMLLEISSYNELSISIFPPNGTTTWPCKNATSILFVLLNQDIWFTSVGPMASFAEGNSYETKVMQSNLGTAAKIGIGVTISALVVTILLLLLYVKELKRRTSEAERLNKSFAAWLSFGRKNLDNVPQLKGARIFSLCEIHRATNFFKPNTEIGVGGYGMVYKGTIASTGEQVAIKRSNASSFQGVTEFRTEVELLSRVHHKNLVDLIGFCFEDGEQILVYKYIPNGTLRDCLSDQSRIQMDWNRRVAIALDAARGIAYLHNDANPPIIHRDIKSSNILVDENFAAKVADFGLCKLMLTGENDNASTNVKGTMGYLDPNYFLTNQLTTKSDIYSFGVVLLELVSGHKPIIKNKYIVHEVNKAFKKGGMEMVEGMFLDPGLILYPQKAFRRLVKLALDCLQHDPTERPTITEVVKELEDLTQTQYNMILNESPKQYVDSIKDVDEQSYVISALFQYSGSCDGSLLLNPNGISCRTNPKSQSSTV